MAELLWAPLRPLADVIDLAAEATTALGTITVITAARWLRPGTDAIVVEARPERRDALVPVPNDR